MTTEVIPARANGPQASANGGYAAGVLGQHVDAPAVRVRLLRPPPLDRPLEVAACGAHLELRDAGEAVATAAAAAPLGLEPPVRPEPDAARDAVARRTPPAADHPFGRCFVCSAHRKDGLGAHFAHLPGTDGVHVAVVEEDRLAGARDLAAVPLLWGAADCPSYPDALRDTDRIALLAELALEPAAPVPDAGPLVVVGWTRHAEGRKHHTASAVLAADGATVATAAALWIELRRS